MTLDNKTVTHETDVDLDAPAPLRFERRTCDRWPTDFTGTAFELAGDSFGAMHQIRVIDYSDGGLGAISNTPLAPGSIVSVGFSKPGMNSKRGTVLRCSPCGEGYRISLQFEARLAA